MPQSEWGWPTTDVQQLLQGQPAECSLYIGPLAPGSLPGYSGCD